ncbi:cytochrome P450 6a8-like [Musca vetustissima]|uniref:cytochrome P450 6a8-like n=1 Tax=Musca vetustissima TaxID=27455 RepID=UPI002AB68164|nr:cytochrome P450 6a8-like [Musca vetustissima]
MNFWMIIIWTLLSSLLSYLKVKYNYWDLQGVKQLKPHFLVGHLRKLRSINHRQILKEVYDEFRSKAKLAGFYIYTQPVAVILDLDLAKSVLVKDFNFFASRQWYKNEKDYLSQHLFNLEEVQWRLLRNKLAPAFTAEKLEFMLPSLQRVAENYVDAYGSAIEESESLNVHDLNGRFILDVFGSCLFGLECNSLKDPQQEEFHQMTSKILPSKDIGIKCHFFKATYFDLMKMFGLKKFPDDVESFFKRVVQKGFVEREKSGVVRNDFIDVLLLLKNFGEMNLEAEQLAAQFYGFFTASYETSAATMTYLLYELARHEDVQEKLRKHITESLKKHNKQVSYGALNDMKYLDQVITETLRMYPPFAYLQRLALEDYKVPGTDITIEKNTDVLIPIKAIHYDADIYENPKEFKPERFAPSEERKRHPQAFLSFGEGPRNCIAMRLAQLQMKCGLVSLLRKYQFSESAQTCKEIEFSDYSEALVPTKPIYLKVEKI